VRASSCSTRRQRVRDDFLGVTGKHDLALTISLSDLGSAYFCAGDQTIQPALRIRFRTPLPSAFMT
jgi:hypothetical protein